MKAILLQVKVKPKIHIQRSFAAKKLLSIAKLWHLLLVVHYMFHRIVFVPNSESGPCGEDCFIPLIERIGSVGETGCKCS